MDDVDADKRSVEPACVTTASEMDWGGADVVDSNDDTFGGVDGTSRVVVIARPDGSDGDELDALILRNGDDIKNDTTYRAYIIGALVMEDEHGMDEKVLCVLGEDYGRMGDISNISEDVKEKINTFFSTYKLNIPGRWSKTYGYISKHAAYDLYAESLIRFSEAT